MRVVPIVNDAFTEITVEDARPLFDIDDELLEKLDPYLGRVAAQAAKQNLMQHLRDTVEAD